MDRERWQRIRELFAEAGQLDEAERRAWLESECDDDPSLADEVLELLATRTRAGSGIDAIVDEAAASYASDIPEGERIGPYRILDTIGRGGMGQVYLAERADDEFRQRVAIKTVGWLGAAPELVERFRIERQILADLQHPYIARLLDGGQADNGTPYLVMEYVDGRSITDYCDDQELGLRERLALFLKVCDAVRYAHRNLTIHRDIKPSNILIDADGDPKLLDFGIAKLLETDGEQRPAVTRADMRVLTPEYASPEQVRGETATTATDVYGLGLLLYQLLTGRFPYEVGNATSPDIARIICETEPTAPSTIVGRPVDDARAIGRLPLAPAQLAKLLAGDLDNIVMKALRKEPERRYESVGELARDVGNYLEDRPVSARTPSLRYRATKFVNRNRAAVAAGTTAVVTIVALTGWYTWRLGVERDVAMQERATAEAATEFMIDLFEVNDPGRSLGDVPTARDVLDRGAEKLADELSDTPVVRARLLQTLGMVYERLGLYDEAQRFLEESAELSRAVLPRTNETQIRGLEQLAWIYYRREDWERAKALASEALALRESLVGDDHPTLGESINMLGTIAFWQDDMDGTLAHYHRALEVLKGDEDWILTERAQTMNHLGITYAYIGESDEAEKYYLASLDQRLKLFDERHPRIGAAKANLASFYHGIDEHEKALGFAEEALEIDRAALGEQHADVAYDLGLLAAIYIELGELDEAEKYAQRAADTWRASVGDEHSRYGSALDRLATLQMEQGALDAALETADRCYAVMVAANGEDHSMTSDALFTRGRVHLRRGDTEAARENLERALDIRERMLGEEHRSYQSTLLLLARADLRDGRYADAEARSERVLSLVERTAPDDEGRMTRALTMLKDVLAARDAEGDAERLREIEARLARLGG